MKIIKGWFICAKCGEEKDRGVPKTIKGKKVIVCMDCINAPQKSHGLAKAHPTCKTQVDTSLPRRNGHLSRSRDRGALNKGESSCQLQLI